jgi:hypothetical protein
VSRPTHSPSFDLPNNILDEYKIWESNKHFSLTGNIVLLKHVSALFLFLSDYAAEDRQQSIRKGVQRYWRRQAGEKVSRTSVVFTQPFVVLRILFMFAVCCYCFRGLTVAAAVQSE